MFDELLKLDGEIIRSIQGIAKDLKDDEEEREVLECEYIDQAISGDYESMLDYLEKINHPKISSLKAMLNTRKELLLMMDGQECYLVQDQTANNNEDMFFVSDENLEGQFSGYVVWRTGNKKELEKLAKKWNLEAKLNMEDDIYMKIIKLFNERKEKQDDGQMWAIIYKDDIEYDDDLEWELFVEWFFPEDCRGFFNDWYIEVNQNILEY